MAGHPNPVQPVGRNGKHKERIAPITAPSVPRCRWDRTPSRVRHFQVATLGYTTGPGIAIMRASCRPRAVDLHELLPGSARYFGMSVLYSATAPVRDNEVMTHMECRHKVGHVSSPVSESCIGSTAGTPGQHVICCARCSSTTSRVSTTPRGPGSGWDTVPRPSSKQRQWLKEMCAQERVNTTALALRFRDRGVRS